ncbi:MAG: homoserine dehydrogenase [Alphaproteobacteria bacterium]|nr:homoserine dehydrogenase [Alphaproteobacteria bacterium]
MSKPLRVGVAGLGTVGAEVVRLLARQGDLIASRCGRRIEVVAVSARDRLRDRGLALAGIDWRDDALGLAGDPRIDVVCELIGGADGVAHDLVGAALGAGKEVVTANKALLAHHGTALAEAAESKGVALGFEAAVAGGIPIIKALREGFAANRIERVFGILNGTCNFILTAMRDNRREFRKALAEAQKLGYAESDPTFDIEGVDTAHKLAILASVAFGTPVDFAGVHVEGITQVGLIDIDFARELGFHIKLLGVARVTEHGLEQRVHPCMVPIAHPIAHVDGSFNAVVVEGDFADRNMAVGRGAGAGPTASAVVADLIDIARRQRLPAFNVPVADLKALPRASMDRHRGAYYVRFTVVDRPGVMADMTAAFRDAQVSIEALIQRGRNPGDTVPVVMTTHDTEEAALGRALARIAALKSTREPPRMIRIEQF